MATSFEFTADGIITSSSRQVGYMSNDVVFAGGNGPYGGRQVGYIAGDVIFAGGNGPYGGHQVGYLAGNDVMSGGNGPYGGQRVGSAVVPHPRWNAAAFFLLT